MGYRSAMGEQLNDPSAHDPNGSSEQSLDIDVSSRKVGSATALLRRDMVGQTAKLVEFLRDLVLSREVPVLDVSEHSPVIWLSDLPTEVNLYVHASAGDTIFSLAPVATVPPPRIPAELEGWISPKSVSDSRLDAPLLERENDDITDITDIINDEYSRWLGIWRLWAEDDRARRPLRLLYDSLLRVYQQLDQHSDEFEFVLATGLLAWQVSDNESVRNHLLSTKMRIVVDADTGLIEIVVDESSTRLEDRDFLDGVFGFDGAHSAVESVRHRLRATLPCPLGDETKVVLEQWSQSALKNCRPYEHDNWLQILNSDVSTTPELKLAPALVYRQRARGSLLQYYNDMLAALSGPDAEAPLGLAQLLVALEQEDRSDWLESENSGGVHVGEDPLFPLPSNKEQREIIERLVHNNGVVVKGPPGTGKSHSIANLLSALLAQGMRVLVTSQKAQALAVLREKIPPEIANLCVSMTDLNRGGSAELNKTVNSLSERFSSYNKAAQDATVANLTKARREMKSKEASLIEEIRLLRESEARTDLDVAPTYPSSLGGIAATLRVKQPFCDWLPVPVPDVTQTNTPLNIEEFAYLRKQLAESTPAQKARLDQDLPETTDLPTTMQIRALVAAESAATVNARNLTTELSSNLAQMPSVQIDYLRGLYQESVTILNQVGLWPIQNWDTAADWRLRVISAGFSGREFGDWQRLLGFLVHVDALKQSVDGIGIRRVLLPDFAPGGEFSLAAQISAAKALRDWLVGGGQIRNRLSKPVQKRAQYLLDNATVDGISPTNPELIGIVIAQAEASQYASALTEEWRRLGVDIASGPHLSMQINRLIEYKFIFNLLMILITMKDNAAECLSRNGVLASIDNLGDWRQIGAAIEAVSAKQEVDRCAQEISDLFGPMETFCGSALAPPELAILLTAAKSRDADRYEETLAAISNAHKDKAEQIRCKSLYERLHSAHAGLAQLLERTADESVWEQRISGFADAWYWAVAMTFFEQQRQPGRDAALDAELIDATKRLGQLTASLAAAQAWSHALSRMTAEQTMALRAYRQAMSDRGKGTGIYAEIFEKSAREAMAVAKDAVPAWIMPLPEVLETIPPIKNSFDVVIVDEASQASIESLFLLWLAPRVIVVGDEQQCAPSEVTHGRLQPIFDRLDAYLSDVPLWMRTAFTPRSSLFSLLGTRFGSLIQLREHFRCMPEIIEWSSRQFYSDSPLIPLRQFGGERLPPLRTTYVDGGFTEGAGTGVHNPVEAEHLVDSLVELLDDPTYKEKTIGVIVLQGRGQIAEIQNRIEERLRSTVREKRRIRVGTAPDFQGDERDIMLISMVVDGTPRAVTRQTFQRSFNVAASRAKDQMWLFHSVHLDALSPMDLRKSLLGYMLNPPPPLVSEPLDDVTENEIHPSFDSLFEQRVFLRIRAQGFHVTPQFDVNGRRIDLVVFGANGRLAVECDGDYWHSTSEQRANDLYREIELKRVGWKFWRVRESEFYFDKDKALSPLWDHLASRGIQPHDYLPSSDATPIEGSEKWVPAKLPKDDAESDFDEQEVDEPEPLKVRSKRTPISAAHLAFVPGPSADEPIPPLAKLSPSSADTQVESPLSEACPDCGGTRVIIGPLYDRPARRCMDCGKSWKSRS